MPTYYNYNILCTYEYTKLQVGSTYYPSLRLGISFPQTCLRPKLNRPKIKKAQNIHCHIQYQFKQWVTFLYAVLVSYDS